ncbi:MAG: 2-phosphosulfolactate phosphatase, partial [FCB group bacterium]|nr:2-phosphosulfolactate phosphatase [FCB group bacterium]
MRAAARGDIIVVVDVLSFSTVVATATWRKAMIYPCLEEDDPGKIARDIGGHVAVRRTEVPAKG